MPKDQVICPKDTRKAGEITFNPVPINQYKPDYKAEEKKYGKERLVIMYSDMLMIREFESMLDAMASLISWVVGQMSFR